MKLTVTDAADRHRFEARIDSKLAGVATYIRRPGVIVFLHTEVELAFEGQGVGGALARAALDDAAARGDWVRASCPFIAGWIARHPDYQRLTAETGSAEKPH
jgi:predicted GNAT family acetyltransferase